MTAYDKLGTQMQGVSTIVAVPQWYLQNNLDLLVKNGETTAGKKIKDVYLTDPTDGNLWLSGVLSALKVHVYVPGAPTRMKFILQFASGTMQYVDEGGIAPKQLECKIDGLVFGFDVNLSYQDVEDNPDLPPDVRAAVSSLLQYKDGGAFTIQHLFMELENAAVEQYDPALTVWSPDMPQAARDQFPRYLGSYLTALTQVGGNTLGYAIAVDTTADSPATFPATSLRYRTNQYQNGAAGDATLDCVLYLMMTDGEDFPKTFQPWWGDLTVPDDRTTGWNGTMAVAERKFVPGFLLPSIAPLLTSFWKLRDGSGLDAVYDLSSGSFTPTALGGHFDSGQQTGISRQNNPVSVDTAKYLMQVVADVGVSPGKNLIVITRTTTFQIDFRHWYGFENASAKSEYRVKYVIPVTYVITLSGAMDGTLQVGVDVETKPRPTNVLSSDPYFWYITESEGSTSIWSTVSDRMTDEIDRMAALALSAAIPPGLTDALKQQLNLNPFVFPGSGQLFLGNLLFDYAGDLLVGLQYKS